MEKVALNAEGYIEHSSPDPAEADVFSGRKDMYAYFL